MLSVKSQLKEYHGIRWFQLSKDGGGLGRKGYLIFSHLTRPKQRKDAVIKQLLGFPSERSCTSFVTACLIFFQTIFVQSPSRGDTACQRVLGCSSLKSTA